VSADGFRHLESGGVTMDDATRKECWWRIRSGKQEEIVHPFIEERVPFGMIPFVQATLLARHLRGDLEAYPSFLWK